MEKRLELKIFSITAEIVAKCEQVMDTNKKVKMDDFNKIFIDTCLYYNNQDGYKYNEHSWDVEYQVNKLFKIMGYEAIR